MLDVKLNVGRNVLTTVLTSTDDLSKALIAVTQISNMHCVFVTCSDAEIPNYVTTSKYRHSYVVANTTIPLTVMTSTDEMTGRRNV